LVEALSGLEKELGVSFAKDEGLRYIHRARLLPLFQAAIAARGASSLADDFAAHGVCWSRYQPLSHAVASDARLFTRNPIFSMLTNPSGHRYLTPGAPVRIPGETRQATALAPRLGEHTDEILSTLLKLPGAEIGRLHDRGIIAGVARP
jgi:2-methylfumaryl-CoA isomerase